MNKLHNGPDAPEIDQTLCHMEASELGQTLRAGLAGQDMPQSTAQRLQTRVYKAASTRAQAGTAPRLSPGEWVANRLGVLRLTGGLALVVLVVAALAFVANSYTPVASASELLQKAEKHTASTVDPGKVRHIVRKVSETGMDGRPDADYVAEIWMTQGQDHLLTHWEIHDRQGTSTEFKTSLVQVIGEKKSWNSDPATNTVYEAPFGACAYDLGQWLGDKAALQSWSENAHAKIVGTENINGVQAQIIEIDSTRLWVNPDSGLILLMMKSSFAPDGAASVATDRLVSDETIDVQSAPAGLFTFTPPAGSILNVQDTPMCGHG